MQKAARLSPLTRVSRFLTKPISARFSHSFEREMFFVVTVGLVAFFATALATFNPLDQSFHSVSFPPSEATNAAGTIGAHLAGALVFLLGMSAWILPIPTLMIGWQILRKTPETTTKSILIGWSLTIASVAAIMTTIQPTVSFRGFDLPTGGIVGEFVLRMTLAWFGKTGSIVVSATALLCAAILISRKDLLSAGAVWARTWFKKLRSSQIPLLTLLRRGKSEDQETTPETSVDSEPGLFGRAAPHAIQPPETSEIPGDKELNKADWPMPVIERDDYSPITPLPETAEKLAQRPSNRQLTPDNYAPPPIKLLNRNDGTESHGFSPKDLEATGSTLVKTFADFGVHGQIVGYQPGPVVTVFEFQPEAGVKQSKILGLIDDIALALKVDSIFIHPVRGKRALGVQVPNPRREQVYLGDILATRQFTESSSPLTFGLGKALDGSPMCTDLSTMPHLLVAGATGSGKSVAVNAMLTSIIMKARPSDVRMILVDPKMLELSVYEGIPHLLMPVITEPAKASLALKWAAAEMERRYKLMQLACVRNIAGFNEFWAKAPESRKSAIRETIADESITTLPYIMLVIDELADLMMTAPKDVESSIQRLAQKARASGIHMVLATQRPSVDIITGVIKANLPCRMAFQVVSKHDSRTILDLIGAEKLLGKGDMLLQRPGTGRLERIQGALISDDEVLNLVAAVKKTGSASYDESIMNWIDDEYARQLDTESPAGGDDVPNDSDPKFTEAINLARTHGVVSASFLQRHLKIGYNRAARMVEFMESRGMVDKADGAKPRKWLGNNI